MSGADLIAILPFTITTATSVLVMALIAVRRNHLLVFCVTIAGLTAALASLAAALPEAPRVVTGLIAVDRFSLFFVGLVLAATLVIAVFSYAYLGRQAVRREEYYILITLAAVGAEVLAAASHYASFFLGLELLSVALYGLVAYRRDDFSGIEAGVKYLILAGVSSGFLLFGMALIYAEQGTLQFVALLAPKAAPLGILALVGFTLLAVGVGFKLAVVPFHFWTPDVYQGAPAPVAALVATTSKGAMFALLLRYFVRLDLYRYRSIVVAFAIIAGLSILAGNILALFQTNVKRVLAYSSIAHLGYLLVALLASGSRGVAAVSFYLVAYFITNLGAFGVVGYLSSGKADAEELELYRGLAWRHPWIAGVFTAMLLSLAGIPLTAGFIGKFFIVAAGAGAGLWSLLIALVVGSVISFFYYLRIIIAMFRDSLETAPSYPSFSLIGGVSLSFLTVALLWLGIYPTPLVDMLDSVTAVLF